MGETCDGSEIERREDLILGRPPRLSPPSEISDEIRDLATAPIGLGWGRSGRIPDNYAIMLNAPEIFRLAQPLGVHLLVDGALAPRDRELAILRVVWLCQCPYVWGEHVFIGKSVGLTSEDVERITQGSAADGWNAHEAAVLRAVEELFKEAMISDATWETLAATLDARQLIEFTMLVGHYQGLAYYMNSLRVPIRAANPGLSAR